MKIYEVDMVLGRIGQVWWPRACPKFARCGERAVRGKSLTGPRMSQNTRSLEPENLHHAVVNEKNWHGRSTCVKIRNICAAWWWESDLEAKTAGRFLTFGRGEFACPCCEKHIWKSTPNKNWGVCISCGQSVCHLSFASYVSLVVSQLRISLASQSDN